MPQNKKREEKPSKSIVKSEEAALSEAHEDASEHIPEEIEEPGKVISTFRAIFGGRIPIFPPYFEKVTEEHLSRVLELGDKQDERQFEFAKRRQNITTGVIAGIFVLIIFFTVFMLMNGERNLYWDIIKIILGFAGGFGAGYGFRVRR